MALRGWTWDAAMGPAGLGDRPLLEAVRAAIPDGAVQAAIEATGTRERRRRLLPTGLVVTLVVAMGLWTAESVRHALAAVVDGWREGTAATTSGWRLMAVDGTTLDVADTPGNARLRLPRHGPQHRAGRLPAAPAGGADRDRH